MAMLMSRSRITGLRSAQKNELTACLTLRANDGLLA